MGGLSIWHILLVAAIVLILFGGRGKLSDIMGDFAKGIKSFKKGLTDEDQPQTPPRPIEHDETKDKDTAAH
jgi:sec-independent protein translocase protein TatA